jgi:hypothetical protein
MRIMPNSYTDKHKTFTAGEALPANRVVKLSAAQTVMFADDEEVVEAIGVTIGAAANGEAVEVKLFNDGGTFVIESSADVTAAGIVTIENDGKISDDGTLALGYAIEAGTGSGVMIEVVVTKV